MSTEKIAEIKLTPATDDLSSKIYEGITVTVTGKDGDVAGLENIYEATLPSDPVPDNWLEAAKRLGVHNETFIAAAVNAIGDAARAKASENSELRSVDATFPMIGRNKLDVSWNHSEERNAGIPKKGEVAEKKTVYGTMTAKLTVAGTDSGSGELGKVFRRQKQAAHELFGAVTAA